MLGLGCTIGAFVLSNPFLCDALRRLFGWADKIFRNGYKHPNRFLSEVCTIREGPEGNFYFCREEMQGEFAKGQQSLLDVKDKLNKVNYRLWKACIRA